MRARYLSSDELKRLARVLGDKWLPFEIALVTGMRIGDVLKLRPWDFAARGERVFIVYTADKTGKRGEAEISASLVHRLWKSAKRTAWCFPSPTDRHKHLTRQAAWARIKRAAKLAGVELDGAAPHSLRKSFAVELLKRSNIGEVRRALQHERIDTTELYALADWTTGENAGKPLLRGDLPRLVGQILAFFGVPLDGGRDL